MIYDLHGEKVTLAVTPIYLALEEGSNLKSLPMYYLGVVAKQSDLIANEETPVLFNENDYISLSILGLLLMLLLIFSAVLAYEVGHYIISPLRMLNDRLITIVTS